MSSSNLLHTSYPDWLNELENPEVQESLAYLIQKLPDLQKGLEKVENFAQFSQNAMMDKETISRFENNLNYSSVNADSLDALFKLIGKLPMLLELVEKLEQMTVFIENTLGDRRSIESLYESLIAQPVVEQGQDVIKTLTAIKEKAETTPQEPISIFTVLKWIKDPSTQKVLHYIQSTIDVINKKV